MKHCNECDVEEHFDVDASSNVEEVVPCSVCGDEAVYMGTMGFLLWYQCVYCGTQFAKNVAEAP